MFRVIGMLTFLFFEKDFVKKVSRNKGNASLNDNHKY